MIRTFRLPRLASSQWRTSYISLTESMFTSNEKEIKAGDTAWIDGIRGIAACMVVMSHIIMSLHDSFVYPSSPEAMLHDPSHWPFIHAPAEGFPWLATFFVLSGWVNALKPLSLVDSGESDRALMSLSSGCLRRSARLMLPPAIATAVSWLLAQVGAYKIANAMGNSWMKNTSPEGSATWGAAVSELLKGIYTTWTEGTNYYDGNQWCMLSFLKGSMTLYLILMATVKATPTMRRVILGIMFLWSWKAHDEFVAIPTYAGILLADISLHKSVQSLTSTPTSASRIISTILFTSGAYLISVPNVHMEWSPFFKFITAPGALFGSIFYPDGGTVYHLTNYMGLFLVFAGIVLSQSLQRFFAFQAFVRLGQLSLPIYLLHGPILRTLGATLLYYGTTPGMPVSVFREFFAMGVFAATTLFMAKRWEERVEPWCAKITMILDDLVTGKVAATVRVTERAPASATV